MKSAGRERRRRSLGLVLACIAAAGCRDSDRLPDDPIVTAPSTPVVETTTAPLATATTLIPLDQDPPVIDLAYAQRVLDEISRLDHEASLILYREKRVTPEHEAIVASIFFGQALADAREATEIDLSVGLATWREPPGPPVRSAIRLVTGTSDCIALIANTDYRPRYSKPVEANQGVGVLLQRNINPTPDQKRIHPSSWLETASATIAPGKDLSRACN
jgi:hypothetical protein